MSKLAGTAMRKVVDAREGGHQHVGLVPDQAARGRGPALRRAEQLHEPLARLGVVLAPGRLDHDLGAERDRVHLAPAGLGHVHVEVERRDRGVAPAGRAEHLELRLGRHRRRQRLGLAHAATVRSSSK